MNNQKIHADTHYIISQLEIPRNKKVEETSGAIFEVEYGTQLFYENLMSISKGRKQLYF